MKRDRIPSAKFQFPSERSRMTSNALFEPYAFGELTIANRIVMAPLTRNRAGAGLVATDLMWSILPQCERSWRRRYRDRKSVV